MNITLTLTLTLISKSSAAPMKCLPSGKRIVVPLSKLFLWAHNERLMADMTNHRRCRSSSAAIRRWHSPCTRPKHCSSD